MINRNSKEISSITFGILSPEEIKAMAVCEITNTKLSGPNSVYDPRMGTISETPEKCITCNASTKICPGHFGYITLAEPVINPLFIKTVVLLLKCFCTHCYRLIIHPDQIKLKGISKYKGEIKFSKIQKIIKKIDICGQCGHPQPKVVHKSVEGIIQLEYKSKDNETQKGGKYSIVLNVEDIKKIFDNVLDQDIVHLGFNPELMRPRNLIMTVFPVLPPCSRPYIINDGVMSDDDLTIHTIEIVKDCIKLTKNAEENKDPKVRQKLINSLKFHISTFFNNSKGTAKHPTDNQPIKGIKERISSKDGQLRQNHMGKRVDFSSRTVIGPDPTLKMDEMGMPEEIAQKLTFPENVNAFNINQLTKLVNEGKANFVIRNDGQTTFNLQYAMYKKGTELLYNDVIVKDKSIVLKDDGNVFDRLDSRVVFVRTGKEVFRQGDRLVRDGKLFNYRFPSKQDFKLKIGDVVERHLRDGDIVLLNRQPTLERGGMIARKIVVRPHKTFRLNLESCKSYNADFDGDEMNVHAPQSYETVAELKLLSATKNMVMSAQASKPNLCIVQDSLLGAYRMTKGLVPIKRDAFFNITMNGCKVDGSPLWNIEKIKTISRVFKKFGKPDVPYSGYGLFSLILPDDLYYEKTTDVNTVRIYQGVMYEGTLNKAILGSAYNSLIQILFKEYGVDVVGNFIDNVQFLTNNWLLYSGFSVGMEDCMITSQNSVDTIQDEIAKAYIKAQSIEESTQNAGIREIRVTAALSQAKDIGMNIAKKAMSSRNNFLDTVNAGSKGDFFNIAQITGVLGQQNLNGQRVKPTMNHNTRTLPHYPKDGKMSKEMEYESKGFIKNSLAHGLTPQEFFFHAMSGREGVCDSAMSTADSGYVQRRIIKLTEDIKIQYDGTVRDIHNMVYQNVYGENGFDPTKTVKVGNKQEFCDVSRIVDRLNKEYMRKEEEKEKEEKREEEKEEKEEKEIETKMKKLSLKKKKVRAN